MTKPLQVAGQRRYKIDMAEHGVTQARLDFEEASRNVFRDVASEWIDVWGAQVNLSILLRGQHNIDSLVQVNHSTLIFTPFLLTALYYWIEKRPKNSPRA